MTPAAASNLLARPTAISASVHAQPPSSRHRTDIRRDPHAALVLTFEREVGWAAAPPNTLSGVLTGESFAEPTVHGRRRTLTDTTPTLTKAPPGDN